MRYIIIAGLLSIALAIALGAAKPGTAGANDTGKPEGEDVARKKSAKNDVEMTLSAKNATPAGESLPLEVVIRNKGKDVVRYGPTDAGYGDFQILVVDAAGKGGPLTRMGKASGVVTRPARFAKFTPKPIRPGEACAIRFNLALLYDLTLAGKYGASVAVEIYPAGSPKDGREFVIKAADLTFEVTSPAPPLTKKLARSQAEKGS